MPILTRCLACVTAALLAQWFTGCGGSTTEGTGSTAGSATAYCHAEAGWRQRCANASCPSTTACAEPCPPPTPQPCTVTNLTCDKVSTACLDRMFRPEALAKMIDCENHLACTGGREECLENIALPDPLPSAVDFQSACQARLQACAGQVGEETFFCSDLSWMTEEVVALMRACLDGPCPSIRSCQDGAKFDGFCAR